MSSACLCEGDELSEPVRRESSGSSSEGLWLARSVSTATRRRRSAQRATTRVAKESAS